jgi:hypothetical protein
MLYSCSSHAAAYARSLHLLPVQHSTAAVCLEEAMHSAAPALNTCSQKIFCCAAGAGRISGGQQAVGYYFGRITLVHQAELAKLANIRAAACGNSHKPVLACIQRCRGLPLQPALEHLQDSLFNRRLQLCLQQSHVSENNKGLLQLNPCKAAGVCHQVTFSL